MFWQNSNEYIGTPGIADIIMSRNRFAHFLFLTTHVTLVMTNLQSYTLATLLTTQFQSLYTLHQQVTIDEAMIPCKGRPSFKQYM